MINHEELNMIEESLKELEGKDDWTNEENKAVIAIVRRLADVVRTVGNDYGQDDIMMRDDLVIRESDEKKNPGPEGCPVNAVI